MTYATYRLLIVDDEETMRRTLADILRLEGYTVETAKDGEEAIHKISQALYDLVLLDLKMPGVDGLEVLRFMSDTLRSPASQKTAGDFCPTVILLTAHGSLESAIEALRYGAYDYLLKPASPEQILNSVARGLQERTRQIQNNALLHQIEQSHESTGVNAERAETMRTRVVYQLPHAITIDLFRREIYFNKQTIKLTPTEGKLINVFLQNPHRVFTHRELVLRVQGYETKDWEAPEVLRPLVSRLRHKLARLPDGKNWIISVRGTGYVFEVEGIRLPG